MFLGSVFHDKRLSMNLTQNDLSNDICTQNTISKMEKHNLTPQIDVLIKLCQRLNLTLNDVFSDFSRISQKDQTQILVAMEQDILSNHLGEVEERLKDISSEIADINLKRYDFIHGVIGYLNGDYGKSSFDLDRVLQETRSDDTDVYTVLAYLYRSMIYQKQDHLDMMKYYIQMVSDKLQGKNDISNATEFELLFIYKMTTQMLLLMDENDQASKIAQLGIEYANDNHVSYFIDELNFGAALAIKEDARKSEQFSEYKHIAYYTASLLNNTELKNKMEQIF